MSLEQVVYRAKAKATGGRDGRATSSDGVLDVQIEINSKLRKMLMLKVKWELVQFQMALVSKSL